MGTFYDFAFRQPRFNFHLMLPAYQCVRSPTSHATRTYNATLAMYELDIKHGPRFQAVCRRAAGGAALTDGFGGPSYDRAGSVPDVAVQCPPGRGKMWDGAPKITASSELYAEQLGWLCSGGVYGRCGVMGDAAPRDGDIRDSDASCAPTGLSLAWNSAGLTASTNSVEPIISQARRGLVGFEESVFHHCSDGKRLCS